MFPFLRRKLWLLLCLAALLPAAAQLLPQSLGKSGNNAVNGAAPDPLGRDTPSGTLFGFLQAAQAGNYSTAAQYLQMPAARRQTQGEELASKLKVVMDRAFSGNLRRVSDQPEGVPQEGLSLDRQRVGVLAAGDVETDLTLVRVTDPSGTRIWLISSDTLAKVPELYDQDEVRQVESHLPHALVRYELLGVPLWQWLAIVVAIPVAAGLGFVVVRVLRLPLRFWVHDRTSSAAVFRARIANPLWLVLSVLIHGILVAYLRLPLLQRHYYQQSAGVILIIGVCWLLWRALQWLLRMFRQRAIAAERLGTSSLMLLGERMLKAAIVILAIFGILGDLGFNMTAALAGLGIGGIAIAFAAQKTLENLLGGMSVLGDEVIRVGDTCRFGDRVGTVEDISLRSTRIRTPERTQLSIPNGSLATMNIENLTLRDKILFNTKVGLRYETSPDQLRYVLAQIRRLLYEHPKVETDGARVRLIGFDDSTLTLEIFCYVLTRDFAEFLAIREDLLLRIMEIVNSSGSGFGFPSQTLYLGRDSGLDKDKTESVHREVQQWRKSGNLPFPDFEAKDISEFSNSLPYPQPESAVRRQK
jgi:MscS family membrane protein